MKLLEDVDLDIKQKFESIKIEESVIKEDNDNKENDQSFESNCAIKQSGIELEEDKEDIIDSSFSMLTQ